MITMGKKRRDLRNEQRIKFNNNNYIDKNFAMMMMMETETLMKISIVMLIKKRDFVNFIVFGKQSHWLGQQTLSDNLPDCFIEAPSSNQNLPLVELFYIFFFKLDNSFNDL